MPFIIIFRQPENVFAMPFSILRRRQIVVSGFTAYDYIVARMHSIRGNHHALPYGKTRQLLLQVDKN